VVLRQFVCSQPLHSFLIYFPPIYPIIYCFSWVSKLNVCSKLTRYENQRILAQKQVESWKKTGTAPKRLLVCLASKSIPSVNISAKKNCLRISSAGIIVLRKKIMRNGSRNVVPLNNLKKSDRIIYKATRTCRKLVC